jgi:WD40 repeat protein
MSEGTFEITILPNQNDLRAQGGTERPLQSLEAWPATAEYRAADSLSVERAEGAFAYDREALLRAGSVWSREYGTVLGASLFRGGIRALYDRARNVPDGQSLHVLLSLEASSLRALNWHFLCGPVSAVDWDFLGLRPRTPFCLYQAGVTDSRFPPVGPSALQMLLVVASPHGAAEAPEFDVAGVAGAVRSGLGDPDRCDVLARPSIGVARPTMSNLLAHLAQGGYTLLHLVCHGRYVPAARDFSLYLEQDDGTAHRVSGTYFIEALRRMADGRPGKLPYFLFLCACETDTREASDHDRLAQALVRDLGLPAAVGMAGPVPLETATAVASSFYPELRRHGQPDLALAEARAVLAGPTVGGLLVPVLVSQLGGRALFDPSIDSPPTGPATLDATLVLMGWHIRDHAPVLTAQFEDMDRAVRAANFGSKEWEAALEPLNRLANEVLGITFNAYAGGKPPSLPDRRCPFVGMRSFQFEEQSLFKGRSELIGRLADGLKPREVLVVSGPSGSGKSSVVRAGLLPHLIRHGTLAPDQFVVLAPGTGPVTTLDAELKRKPNPLVIVVDQFEELITHNVPADRQASFVNRLLDECRRGRSIVLTVREEFLTGCLQFHGLAEWFTPPEKVVTVKPMGADELQRAVKAQAAEANLEFDANLLPAILRDVAAEPGRMPLLQHALRELWKLRHGRWLRADRYVSEDGRREQVGGAQQAIARTADGFVRTLSDDDRRRVMDLLLRMVRVDESSEAANDTKRRVRIDDLVPAGERPDTTRRLLTELANRYLVVTTDREAELAHEALIRHWPLMRQSVEARRQKLLHRQEVGTAARTWSEHGRYRSDLMHRGRRLEELRALGAEKELRLNATEAEYLLRCSVRESVEKMVLKVLSTMLSLLGLFLFGSVYKSLRDEVAASKREAVEQARHAEAEKQLREAAEYQAELKRREAHVANAILTQIACHERDINAGRERLELQRPNLARHESDLRGFEWYLWWRFCHRDFRTLSGLDREVWATAFADADTVIAVTGERNQPVEVGTWSTTGQLIRKYCLLNPYEEKKRVRAVTLSTDGKRLAVCTGHEKRGSEVGTVTLWDLTPGRGTNVPLNDPEFDGRMNCVAFSPSGDRLAAGSAAGDVRVWDTAIGKRRCSWAMDGPHPRALAFNSRGLLAVAADGEVALGDTAGSSGPECGLVGPTNVSCLCFSADGRMLAVGTEDGSIQLRDPADKDRLFATLRDPASTAPLTCLAFAPGPVRLLASGSMDHSIRLWDLKDRQLQDDGFRHSGTVAALAFGPDGKALVSGGWDGKVKLWHVPEDRRRETPQEKHARVIRSIAFSTDGQWLATGSADRTAIVWDVETAQPTLRCKHGGAVNAVAFLPAEKVLATGSEDGTIKFWTCPSGAALPNLEIRLVEPNAEQVPLDRRVLSLAFAPPPDGRLAVGTEDGSVRIYERTNGRGWKCVRGPVRVYPHATYRVVWSPDGSALAITGQGGVVVWDRDLDLKWEKKFHEIWAAAFSPDGRTLAIGGTEKKVRSYDAETGTFVEVFEEPGQDHVGLITGLAFSPDGSTLASSSEDGTVKLWSRKTKRCHATLRGHGGIPIQGVAFAPGRADQGGESRTLASAGADGAVRFWRAVTEAGVQSRRAEP